MNIDETAPAPTPGLIRSSTWRAQVPTPEVIRRFVEEQYPRDHYEGLAKRASELVEKGLRAAGVQANVRSRAKTQESLEEKLRMRHEEQQYRGMEHIRDDIADLAGVRIILYMPTKDQHVRVRNAIHSIWGDTEPILHPTRRGDYKKKQSHKKGKESKSEAKSTQAENHEEDQEVKSEAESTQAEDREEDQGPTSPKNRDLEEEEYREIHLGYQAVHYRCLMKKEHAKKDGGYHWLLHDRVEIQVVSALVHAWAEVGHDVLYKGHAYGKPTIQERRILDALNGLIQSGDLLLQQFQELVEERTYKEFAHSDELGSCLRKMDILKCPGGPPRFEGEALEVLFRFLTLQGKNFPLALRDALKEFGFPKQNNLKEFIVEEFQPSFQPADGMLATICLIRHMIGSPETEKKEYLPAKQCCIMMKALILLQNFFRQAELANKYLREDVRMTEEEKSSIEFVLMDPFRQEALDERDPEYDESQEKLKPKLQSAWDWFQVQVKSRTSICGLVFRLVEMGATKDVEFHTLLDQLTIGSLSRSSTWGLDD